MGTLLLGPSRPVAGQVRVRHIDVPNTVSCTPCQIRVREEARIGPGEPRLVEWPQSIWRDGSGRLFLMQPNRPEPPMVFDSAGRFLRVLGRRGAGPGEFQNAALVFGDRHDSTFVADWGTSRVTVFDAALRPVRAFSFPSVARAAVVLGDGTLLANAVTADPASVGLAFQFLDRTGRRITASGNADLAYVPSTQNRFVYRLGAASVGRRGSFWAVPLFGQHRIEHWVRPDSVELFLRGATPWFVAAPGNAAAFDPNGGVSWLMGVWESPSGLVWTLARVPDLRGPSSREPVRTPEGVFAVPRDMDREFDTVVEVLDPRTGGLVTSQRFDELFALSAGQGRVAHIKESPSGELVIRIVHLELVRPPGRGSPSPPTAPNALPTPAASPGPAAPSAASP